jgi:hypothetical protein
MYPKLRQKHGPEVLYTHSPSRHVMVEFAFDVVQVARGTFKADVYQDLIGFQVAPDVLERAFRATYSLGLEDVFGDVDMAIGTYRRAASEIIPDVTRMAWRDKRDEILATNPKLTQQDFVFRMTRRKYEDAFGTNYRKPSLLARFVVAVFKLIPKFGPFKPLAFEPLTPEAERLFLESFESSRNRYRQLLRAVRAGKPAMGDTDLDTGKTPAPGVNPLADETYDELLGKLADTDFAGLNAELRRAINDHYATPRTEPHRKHTKRTARRLAALNASASTQ